MALFLTGMFLRSSCSLVCPHYSTVSTFHRGATVHLRMTCSESASIKPHIESQTFSHIDTHYQTYNHRQINTLLLTNRGHFITLTKDVSKR